MPSMMLEWLLILLHLKSMVIFNTKCQEKKSKKRKATGILKLQFYFIFYPTPLTFSESPEILPMNIGKEIVNEGDFGQLVCTVIRGDEPLSFTWSLHGDVVSSEPGLMTSQLGTRTSILMINSVGHRHIGKYTCNVSNVAGSASSTAKLKVNGQKRKLFKKRMKEN